MSLKINARMLLLGLLLTGLFCALRPAAAEQSVSHTYPPLEWSYQGNEVPDTYWTPWLPLGAQEITRFRFGFRFSSGTIAVKCPVTLTFKYDPAQVQAGGDVAVKIKAELAGADYNTFESAFGLHLPNEIQIGFFGITGIPDILPWYTLPIDLCGILQSIPGLDESVGQVVGHVCSAIQNVGVNMSTADALPLPGVKSYHDTRQLISVDLSKAIPKSKVNDLTIALFNRLSSSLGPNAMEELLTIIRLTKGVNQAGAVDFLTGLCGKAAEKIVNLAKIGVTGDPYFSVEGVELLAMARMYIPGGKGSGTYPLTFTSSGQEQTVTFRDITPFIGDNDKLRVAVDNMTYRFKLKQGLIPIIDVGPVPVPVPSNEKYITLTGAKKDFPESEFVVDLPIRPSTEIVQSLRTNGGCTSMSVNFASPLMPLKATVKAYDGQTLVKTVTENGFKTAHNVIVSGLTKGKTYRFIVEARGEHNESIAPREISGATRASDCPTRTESLVCNALQMANPSVQAGVDYIDVGWTTNQAASTETMFSPSPDISVNYVVAVKKQDGQVTHGWVTQGGSREFTTSHSMRISGLEPNTTYYYNLRSWTFTNNDETKQPLDKVGYVGQVTTLAPPPAPVMRVKVIFTDGRPVADVPVEIIKSGESSPVSYVTGSDGYTLPILQTVGATYTMRVQGQACYQDVSQLFGTVPPNVSGEWVFPQITLSPKPFPGGYVYDTQGQPVSGATVLSEGKQVTTNGQGYYTFGEWRPAGPVQVSVSKTGYVTRQVTGKIVPCGLTRNLVIDPVVLSGSKATLNITVKNKTGGRVSGAQIIIREGQTQYNPMTTNAQGQATFVYDFQSNQAHQLTIKATPATGSGLTPASAVTTIAGGAPPQAVDMVCLPPPPTDTQPPVISNISMTQAAPNKISVFFKVNEAIASTGWEIQKPDGQTFAPSPMTPSSLPGSLEAGYTHTVQQSTLAPGTYKIKVKAKDMTGNEAQTAFTDFNLFGAGLWAIKLSGSGAAANSITVSWAKYPHASGFGKYVVTLKPQSGAPVAANITDINTTTHTFGNLNPNTAYSVFITAQSPAGQALTNEWSLGTRTAAPAVPRIPPTIKGVVLSPAQPLAGQTITLQADISDDVLLARVEGVLICEAAKQSTGQIQPNKTSLAFTHTFKVDAPGECTACIYAYDDLSLKASAEKKFVVEEAPKKEVPVEEKKEPVEQKTDLKAARPTVASKLGIPAEKEAGEIKSKEQDIKPVEDKTPPVETKPEAALSTTTESTVIKFLTKPSKADVNEEVSFKVAVQTPKGKKVGAVCILEWGDGSRDKAAAGTPVPHVYREPEKYKITATAVPEDSGAFAAPDPAGTEITIEVAPPKISLTKVSSKAGPLEPVFKIKIEEGSYPVGRWTLSFGDGKSESGKGPVEEKINHSYPAKGKYKVELSVESLKRGTTTKTLNISI